MPMVKPFEDRLVCRCKSLHWRGILVRNSKDKQDAVRQVEDFLLKVCPAMSRKRQVKKGSLPRIEDTVFLPLHLDTNRRKKSSLQLTFRKSGPALSADNASLIPAGDYRILVYDTMPEALAALRALEAIGMLECSERYTLASGEGVILLRTASSAASGNLVPAGMQSMGRGSFKFSGDGGEVTINIIDNRLNLADEGVACTRRREVYASISYPSEEVVRIANNAGLMVSDHISRGRVLARLVEEGSGSLNALRHCQRSLENIPGALVAMAALSVDNVLDQFDEMLEGLENEMVQPPEEDLHDLVVAQAKKASAGVEGLARDIAWSALHKNMTKPA